MKKMESVIYEAALGVHVDEVVLEESGGDQISANKVG